MIRRLWKGVFGVWRILWCFGSLWVLILGTAGFLTSMIGCLAAAGQLLVWLTTGQAPDWSDMDTYLPLILGATGYALGEIASATSRLLRDLK